MIRAEKAAYWTAVYTPMSETPNMIEFITIKLSAAELEKASKVAFIVSELKIPRLLMVSIAGLM